MGEELNRERERLKKSEEALDASRLEMEAEKKKQIRQVLELEKRLDRAEKKLDTKAREFGNWKERQRNDRARRTVEEQDLQDRLKQAHVDVKAAQDELRKVQEQEAHFETENLELLEKMKGGTDFYLSDINAIGHRSSGCRCECGTWCTCERSTKVPRKRREDRVGIKESDGRE